MDSIFDLAALSKKIKISKVLFIYIAEEYLTLWSTLRIRTDIDNLWN